MDGFFWLLFTEMLHPDFLLGASSSLFENIHIILLPMTKQRLFMNPESSKLFGTQF